MDFSLNEEQEIFQKTIHHYLTELGSTEIARRYADGDDSTMKKLWKQLGEMGYLGITISETYGGSSLDQLSLIAVLERMGQALLPTTFVETLAFAVPMVEKYGTNEQKEFYLPQIAAGNCCFSLAFLEPNGSYDIEDITMEAREDGDTFILQGVKTMVPIFPIRTVLIVPVRMGGNVSLLLVDAADEGISVEPLNHMDETSKLETLTFSNVSVSKGQLLGKINDGKRVLEEGLDYLNLGISAFMAGCMDKVLDMAVTYSKERVQFGKYIGSFQALQHRMVDMKRDVEGVRSMLYYAAWALDQDSPDKSASINGLRAFATEAFLRAAGENIQIHGGIGYTREIDCHLFLKRARWWENYLGSPTDYYEKTMKELDAAVEVSHHF